MDRITWASHIRCLLKRYGFSYVWISQDVGDLFMAFFLQQSYRNILRIHGLPTMGILVSILTIYSTFKR